MALRPSKIRTKVLLQPLALLVLFAGCACGAGHGNSSGNPHYSAMGVCDVRIEGDPGPLSLARSVPMVTWKLQSDRRGEVSGGYEVQAIGVDGRVLWDTGYVKEANVLGIPWGGPLLESRQRFAVHVRAWDGQGLVSAWSQPAFCETGLMAPGDWSGQWIAASQTQDDPLVPQPAPHLRREFTLEKPIVQGRVYIAGVGLHEVYVNGKRIGDRVLEPAFTRYDKEVLTTALDITPALRLGSNAIGVILGNGFLNPSWIDGWDFQTAPWRATPRMQLQLEVEHPDGSRTQIASDRLWTHRCGPIVRDALRNGEVYDARLELPGWSMPGGDKGLWQPVAVVQGPQGKLTYQQMPPIRITGSLPATAMASPKPGVYVYDFGVNMAGWARFTGKVPAGTQVTLKYGERVGDDGLVDTAFASRGVRTGAFQTDQVTFKGDGVESWEPRFVYHGFRYVEVRGCPTPPEKGDLLARIVHTDFRRIGSFRCSNDVLNKLFDASIRSYLSNFMGYPTDCPQREKNGWTADGHLASELGLLAFDSAGAYAKWMRDIRDEQQPGGAIPAVIPTSGYGYDWGNGPAWDSAVFLVPYYIYLYTGDTRPLVDNWPNMKRYLEYLDSIPYLDSNPSGWLGDWVHLDQETPPALTHCGFHVKDAEIAALTASLLGDSDSAARYQALAAEVRRRFVARFMSEGTGKVGSGTQTAQAMALFHGLVPQGQMKGAIDQLLANIKAQGGHVNAGVHGAKWLPRVLSDVGQAQVAYNMVISPDYPGWGNWIAQGATTLWENWKGNDSLNHAFFGDIGAWLMLYLGGVQPDPLRPGWQHIRFAPQAVDGLDWAEAECDTSRGRVASRWVRNGLGIDWEVTVPVGSTATLVVPFVSPKGLNAPGARPTGEVDGRPILEVGSGTYRIQVLK